MKKKLLYLLAIVLVFFGAVAATAPNLPYNQLQQLVAYLTSRANTWTGNQTYTGSVAIGPTTSAHTTLSNSGITKYGTDGATPNFSVDGAGKITSTGPIDITANSPDSYLGTNGNTDVIYWFVGDRNGNGDGARWFYMGLDYSENAAKFGSGSAFGTNAFFADATGKGTFNGTSFAYPKITTTKAANYVVGTDDPRECYGGIIYVTSGVTITACDALAAGMHFTVITIGNVSVTVDPQPDDLIVRDGTAQTDGQSIINTGTAGDMATFIYYSADGWYANTNSWTNGG